MMDIAQNIKVAVDAVVFGYVNRKIQILLIQQKFGGKEALWALPGGFVKNSESLDQAVTRELHEETGVNVNYLEQLYTFGEVNRDTRARVISTAYLALVNPKNFEIKAETDALDVGWFDLENLPKLAFDHLNIIEVGRNRLQSKIHYEPIGFELLNKEFPFSDLEQLYQTLAGTEIDRRNFRKKIMSFGLVTETNKKVKPESGRPAKLFKFDTKKYAALKKSGFHFEVKFA